MSSKSEKEREGILNRGGPQDEGVVDIGRIIADRLDAWVVRESVARAAENMDALPEPQRSQLRAALARGDVEIRRRSPGVWALVVGGTRILTMNFVEDLELPKGSVRLAG